MREPLLDIRNLVTEFHTEAETVKAVNNVSFTLHRGETIGIVGESGSGKSVTSLSCMRLIPSPPGKIMSGEVLYHKDGKEIDLLATSEREMRNFRGNDLAMIFQEPMTSLNPVFTCGNQVMEAILRHVKDLSGQSRWLDHLEKAGKGLVNILSAPIRVVASMYQGRLYKDLRLLTKREKAAKARALELFHEVQLPDADRIYRSYPHEISGGQKQRVMIAMAISCNPSVLIADEPTTALDVTVQKTILELMNTIQAKHNMGIVFITHDLGVIAEVADRVIVMYKGRIVEEGKVMDIFSDPQHPYTKGLLACRPPLDKRLHWLPTIADFMKRDANGKIIETHKSVQELTASLVITDEERNIRHENIYGKTPLLEVRELKTWFPKKFNMVGKPVDFVKAVDGISFDVYPGETLGLVGESGCGKTTLGRTILKLQRPTEGEIIYKGEDITKHENREMRRLREDMQIIFQDPYSSLNPRKTIGNALLEPMKVHNVLNSAKERKHHVYELLEKVGLKAEHFNRYPHEFSGGQRQRICIARTLALKPQFIICDESVSALDVSVQAQVLNLLNELRNEFSFTYIFISHDLSVVKFMSDRMIVMNQGRIEEMGPADEIYNHPKTDYTRSLIDAIPKGRLEDIERNVARKQVAV